MPVTIKPEPLTGDAFAPFGAAFDPPALTQRVSLDNSLVNLRPGVARASYSVTQAAPQLARPAPVSIVERHAFSSQSFTPLDPGRYLVIAGPKNAEGGADLATMRVFIGSGFQSFTYNADVWHGPITPLDSPMRFAIMMFNDGTSGDVELIRFPDPYLLVDLA
ncbi:MAG: ureidoglycolate lyase [Rhizobiales bacterium]|nr:ureidoglycolate lyase [Hyphomicrobiales bacterium]